jgi:endonuclease/exonuclease/phosphatase (EEP) superfamily protein YafD
MNPIRVLAAATAMEMCAVLAALGLAGLGGARSGWLDVINNFAPIILIAAVVGAGLAWVTLEGSTRIVTMALALVAVTYGAALVAPEIAGLWPGPSGSGVPFRVLSANVWYENPSPDRAVASLIASDADAVLLQESDGSLQAWLPRLREHYPLASNCPGSGVQIFTRSPIVAQGCAPEASPSRDLAWVQIRASDGRPITLVTTHLGWPFPPAVQPAQRAVVAGQIRRLATDAMILAGDFNTTPWSFAMRSQDRLFAPLTRRTHAWFSWPARLDALRQPWPLPILPIDHVYAGREWQTMRLTRLRIPGSDHFATLAVFSRRP